jgi:hypothetical protein
MKYLYDCAADSVGLWYNNYFTPFCNDVSSRLPHTFVHIGGRLTRANLIADILKIWDHIKSYSKFDTNFCMYLISMYDESSKLKHSIYAHQNTSVAH